MSVFKSQFSRALEVIKSQYSDVPFPATIKSGTSTSTSFEQLIDSSGNFVNLGVKTGDIVYNYSAELAATVVSVTSDSVIVLNANIFVASGESYTIYQASPQTTIGNQGCNLYAGSTGSVRVTTIGGDIVIFPYVLAGTILPVQVIKVHPETTALPIIALW